MRRVPSLGVRQMTHALSSAVSGSQAVHIVSTVGSALSASSATAASPGQNGPRSIVVEEEALASSATAASPGQNGPRSIVAEEEAFMKHPEMWDARKTNHVAVTNFAA